MTFKDINGQIVTFEEIVGLINNQYDYEVFVGSDSQCHISKQIVIYATCIVIHKKGKGGRIFTARESKPFSNSLKERLMNEVWRSLEVSFKLSEILPVNVELTIHIDVNKSEKYKSGNYTQELVSIVTGQGYKVKVKPDAVAAQSVADRSTKSA